MFKRFIVRLLIVVVATSIASVLNGLLTFFVVVGGIIWIIIGMNN